MSPAADAKPMMISGVSGIGGLLLLFALLYLLSFVQAEKLPVVELEQLDIRSIEIPSKDEDSTEVIQSSAVPAPGLPQLQTKPLKVPSRTVEPMALNLQVDVTQILKERDALDYLMDQRDLFGAFGSVKLEGADTMPKSVYIPPNVFPRELKEQGIFYGRVTLLIEISEQGIPRVRHVVSADYPELIDPVITSVEGAIYSRPKRRGKPTRTIIKSVIHFRSDQSGDSMTQEIPGE
jgi:hypothetical protein